MSEYKYSEPPWHFAPHDRWDKEWLILSNNNRVVGIVHNDDICHEEAEANGKVLVNAPSTLEACRDVYRTAKAVGRSRAKRGCGDPGAWWGYLSNLERVMAIYAGRAVERAGV